MGAALAVITTATLVFIRYGAMLSIMPVISARGVPKHVPVLGALLLTLLVAPTVNLAEVPTSFGQVLLAIAGELGLGLIVGGAVRIVFATVAMYADIVAMQVGLGAFRMLNPILETNEGPLGTLSTLLAVATFLATGQHLRLFEALALSMQTIPPGTVAGLHTTGPYISELVSHSMGLAFSLAAPALTFAWTLNVFIAMVTKLAPRMNIYFSLGISLGSPAGIAMVGLALPWVIALHHDQVSETIRQLSVLLSGVG